MAETTQLDAARKRIRELAAEGMLIPFEVVDVRKGAVLVKLCGVDDVGLWCPIPVMKKHWPRLLKAYARKHPERATLVRKRPHNGNGELPT